jgi:hypothetical protein
VGKQNTDFLTSRFRYLSAWGFRAALAARAQSLIGVAHFARTQSANCTLGAALMIFADASAAPLSRHGKESKIWTSQHKNFAESPLTGRRPRRTVWRSFLKPPSTVVARFIGSSPGNPKVVVPMNALELVKLTPLMERTSGRREIVVALIDGPVLMENVDLWSRNVRHLGSKLPATCAQASSTSCAHGTFVAGVLFAKRSSDAPAICPECTLLVRPIFAETALRNGQMATAMPEELASAIIETVKAGARVINLSAAMAQPSAKGERELEQALGDAVKHNVIVVVAAGNEGMVGTTVITRHPWVIPVAACDLQARPMAESNLGRSIGRNGLMAPGKDITSLGTNGKPQTFGGTSAAVPFVAGAMALLWSEFPSASATQIKLAATQAGVRSRKMIAPPLMDAWAAYGVMKSDSVRR